MSGEPVDTWNEGASTSGVLNFTTIEPSRGTKRKEFDYDVDGKRSAVRELQLTEEDTKDLHDAIVYGEIDEVQEFIKKFPSEKFAYHKGTSAMSRAHRIFRYDIFNLLISNNFRLGPNEKVEMLNPSKKKIAFKINLEHLTKPGYDYLTKLVAKCRLYNCQNYQRTKCFASILQALLNLYEIPQVKVLMKILASCSSLQIAFDFERDHIGMMDPRKNENTRGCYNIDTDSIAIGAKYLLNPMDCYEVYGIMAQMFCYCAMIKIFKNNGKPYFKESTNLTNKYQLVIDDCRNEKHKYEIISNAFNDESKLHAVLIAKVPYILATYQQNKNLQDAVKKEFTSLFQLYDHILPFLKHEANKLRSINAREIANNATCVLIELQKSEFIPKASVLNEFKYYFYEQKIQIYQSNCIKFTMKLMFEKLKIDKKLDSFVFSNQTILDNKHILEACVEAVKYDQETKLIIACNSIDLENIKILRETFFPRDDFIIVANEIMQSVRDYGMPIHPLSHKLSDLSENSPILKKQVDFQGANIPLIDFLKECKEIIDVYPIENIVITDLLRIGQEINFDKNHVIRKYKFPKDHSPLTYKKIINEAENGKVIVLSDAPGNGKTTEFQCLAKKLKESFPFRWVLYIDLKKHVKCFSDQKHSDIFDSSLQLADFFAHKLLKIESPEAEIFIQFFISNRAVILLDGFDEVSPTFKKFMIKLVVAMEKKTKNMLWIATRPLLESDLKENLNTEIIRLTGIEEADRKSFFVNFYNREGISDRDFHTTYDKIENLLKRIEHDDRYWWDNEIENPLFLQIIAKVFFESHENYENYDNIYKIYEKFVNKMFEEAGRKQVKDVEEDLAEFGSGHINIRSYHQKIALEMLWPNDDLSLICDDTKHISPEKLNRVGLMYNDGSDYYFTNKTFAEFFAAEVICKNLFTKKILSTEKFDASIKLFKFVINKKRCEIIRMFIEIFLGDCKDIYDELMISQHSQTLEIDHLKPSHVAKEGLCNLFDFISFKIIRNPIEIQVIWLAHDVTTSLLSSLSSKSIKSYLVLFEDEAIRKILTNEDSYRNNCLYAAAANKNEDVLDFVYSYATEKLSSEDFFSLFKYPQINDSKVDDRILTRLSAKLSQEQVERFLEINTPNEYFTPARKRIFLTKISDRYNVTLETRN